MRVTIRLFARLRDLAGSGELVRDVPHPATVQTVWRALVAEMPSLGEYERTMSVAVNADYSRMTASVERRGRSGLPAPRLRRLIRYDL